MSADRHLARLLRLQQLHGALVRRQAGSLAEADAAAARATDRVHRIEALLGASSAIPGRQGVATLAGAASLRTLLASTLATEQERAATASANRLAEANRARAMDARASRIAEQVLVARRRAMDAAADRHAPPPRRPGKSQP